MKKIVSVSLIVLNLIVLGNLSFASEYHLGPYDTLELEVVNHPELKTKQTVSPDGQVSLPLLGVVSVEGQSLKGFQRFLTNNYSAYLDKPQVVIGLTPKPIYVVQYDLKKDTWEVKKAGSIDEAKAYADLDPTLTIEHGNVYKITMGSKPDFWEDNWYKVLTGAAVAVGIYATLNK
ncbi:MAG: polysaccharide biosynthesis/export family protein [Candidatus Margulisiibacteriota bacterium]